MPARPGEMKGESEAEAGERHAEETSRGEQCELEHRRGEVRSAGQNQHDEGPRAREPVQHADEEGAPRRRFGVRVGVVFRSVRSPTLVGVQMEMPASIAVMMEMGMDAQTEGAHQHVETDEDEQQTDGRIRDLEQQGGQVEVQEQNGKGRKQQHARMAEAPGETVAQRGQRAQLAARKREDDGEVVRFEGVTQAEEEAGEKQGGRHRGEGRMLTEPRAL